MSPNYQSWPISLVCLACLVSLLLLNLAVGALVRLKSIIRFDNAAYESGLGVGLDWFEAWFE